MNAPFDDRMNADLGDDKTRTPPSILEIALAYARDGIRVFPCVNDPSNPDRHKKPHTPHGFKDATADEAAIRGWWRRWPRALIGAPTGAVNGFCTLDLDLKPARPAENGKPERPAKNGYEKVPDWEMLTPVRMRTGGGGAQLFFKNDESIGPSSDRIAYGVDARGSGGYTILPGSIGYEWIGESRDLKNLPPWPEKYRPKDDDRGSSARRKPANDDAPPEWMRDIEQSGRGISDDPEDGIEPASLEEIAAALDAIPNDDLGWDDWNTVIMAIWAATEGSEEGRELAHRFSSKNEKVYVADRATQRRAKATDSTDGRWDHITRSPPSNLSVGKLFWLADKADEERDDGKSWRDTLPRAGEGDDCRAEDDTQATDDAQPGAGATPASVDWPTAFEWIDPKSIPRRRWLYPLYYIRKFLSLTISTGGVGKSSLAIVEALAMASGKALLGPRPEQKLRVWYWNGEDPSDELQRRVVAAATHYKIDWKADVADRLSVNSGRQLELIIAEDNRNGARLQKKIVDELVKRIRSKKIDVVIIDPFVSSHRVAENDNSAIELVAKTWARIADEADCAVMLVHHSRKTGGEGATVEDGRGASALLNAARSARSLNTMTVKEAENANVEERDRRLYFRADLGKANMSRPAEAADWYRLASVDLENHGGEVDWHQGDHVGVVTPWAYPRADRPKITRDDVIRAQAAIRAGGQWRKDQRATPWIGVPIAEALGIDLTLGQSKRMVVRIVDDWLKNEWLVEVEGKSQKRMTKTYVEAGEEPAPDVKPGAE